jgi:hypothetical protein
MRIAVQPFADLGDSSGIGEMDAIGIRIDMLFDQKGSTVLSRDTQQPTVPIFTNDHSRRLQCRQHGRNSVALDRAGEEEAGFGLLLIDRRVIHPSIFWGQLSPW